MKSKMLKSFIPILTLLGLSFGVVKPAYSVTICLKLNSNQIEDNTFPFNDVWKTEHDFPINPSLRQNESIDIWVKFIDDEHLKLENIDFPLNRDESVHIDITGVAGGPGIPGMFDWELLFTGVQGDLQVNPVTGRDPYDRRSGSANVWQDKDLTNTMFRFHDIHLKITNLTPNTLWEIDKVSFGVDADFINKGDWEKEERKHNKKEEGVGDLEGQSPMISFDGSSALSFSDVFIDTVIADGGIPNPSDPINEAEIIISNTTLIKSMDQGWFFEDTNLQIQAGSETVLEANLVDSFLFNSPINHTGFDSEFQADLFDITINNTIGSQYLDELATSIAEGQLTFLSFPSNILASTDNLTNPGSSNGRVWIDNATVPEPSSPLVLLAFGIGGVGLTLKRKLKPSNKLDN